MAETNVEDIKKVAEGVTALVEVILERAKDGLDWKDAEAIGQKLITDNDFRREVVEAATSFAAAIKEFKNLTVANAFEVVQVIIAEIQEK